VCVSHPVRPVPVCARSADSVRDSEGRLLSAPQQLLNPLRLRERLARAGANNSPWDVSGLRTHVPHLPRSYARCLQHGICMRMHAATSLRTLCLFVRSFIRHVQVQYDALLDQFSSDMALYMSCIQDTIIITVPKAIVHCMVRPAAGS
jgi:hypothetical protein